MDWGVWYDNYQWVRIDFDTGRVTLTDNWAPHRGIDTYLWHLDCLGKSILRTNFHVNRQTRTDSFISNELKLSKIDYTYLFNKIELYGAGRNNMRTSDGYELQHYPTPSEPYIQVFALDTYGDFDSRRKYVYARLK